MQRLAHNENSFADVSPADFKLLAKIERRLLELDHIDELDLQRLAGRVLLSAIVFGGLINPNAWRGWLDSLLKVRWQPSHSRFFYKLEPRVFRDWYPDPVTGCIRASLNKKLVEAVELPKDWPDPTQLLQWALADVAEAKPHTPALKEAAAMGPDWLIRTCRAQLNMRIPALLVDHAAGRVPTHRNTTRASRVENKVDRLAAFVASATPRAAWQPTYLDQALGHLWPAFFPDNPLVTANARSFAQSMRDALDEQIAGWQQPANGNSVHLHLLKWLRQRIDWSSVQTSNKQKPIRPSTARHYLAYLAGYDWIQIRRTSIYSSFAPTRIGAVFQGLSDIADDLPAYQAKWLRAAIVSFSHYLHSLNKNIKVAAVRKQMETPHSPRTIVLDTPLFVELLDTLRAWGRTTPEPGEPDRSARAHACILASILMYRAGLRGTEVLNLALDDIAFGSEMAELTVRGSAERPNKTVFSRRTLPLHILMGGDELSTLRRWHACRCDEEFHTSPRAKLISTVVTEALSPDQYLLEPIEAAIRILVGLPLHEPTTRREKGYWYALASPLRHSFATHLITCLLIPDEVVALPLPAEWTADIVSVERKRLLQKAFLPEGHVGLSVMQAVRYSMGHASYTQSLATYMHGLDWLLAAHIWREVSQPKTSQEERDNLLNLLPANARAHKTSVSARHARRLRQSIAQQSSLPSQAMHLKRGRKAKSADGQLLSAASDDSLGKYLLPLAFRRPAVAKLPFSPKMAVNHQFDAPERGWRALHNFFEWRRRGVAAEQAAEQLALALDECQRWMERKRRLEQIRVRPRKAPSSGAKRSSPSLRFPQLNSVWPKPRGRAAAVVESIWAQRGKLARTRFRSSVLCALRKWQADPAICRYRRQIEKAAKFLLGIGLPEEWLVVRLGKGDWQPFSKDMLSAPGFPALLRDKGMQLTVGYIGNDGRATKTYRPEVLHGLLLSVIDSNVDIAALEEARPAQ